MVLVDVNLMGILAFVSVTITVIIGTFGLWGKITEWWAKITGNEIDPNKLPSDSPLKIEFDKLHDSLTDIRVTQEDLQKEIIDLKENQKKIAKKNRGDILELKLMRGTDHKLPPEQIAEWYGEYKALGRNGAMDFVVSNYIHPQEFDYHNLINKKGD